MKFFRFSIVLQTLCLGGSLWFSCHDASAADFVWKGGTKGKASDWFSASNWKSNQSNAVGKNGKVRAAASANTVPGPGDTAIIGAGATVAINQPLTISELTVEDGGVMQGSGSVSVTSSLTLDGAKLQGTGKVTVASDATVTISGDDDASLNVIGKSIDNQGSTEWTSGDVNLLKDFHSSGTFYVACDGSLSAGTGTAPTFYNDGPLIKAISVGQTAIDSNFVNSGDIYVRSGLLNVGSDFSQTAGSLNLDGGDVASDGTLQIKGGIVKGIGTLNCDVVNDGGTFKPGHSPGFITIYGNYTQTSNGSLEMEIGGTDPGSGYDQMNVYGNAYLDGELDISKYNGYMPSAGQTYDLITCYGLNDDFVTFTGLYPGNSLFYKVTRTTSDYMAYVRADTTAPTLTMTQPTSGTNYNSIATAKGTTNDTATGCGVNKVTLRLYRYASGSITAGYWAGGTSWTSGYTAGANEFTANGTTSWSLNLPSLTTGQYYIRVTARDNLGNTSTTGNVVFNKVASGGSTASIMAPSTSESSAVARLFPDEAFFQKTS